MTPLERIHTGGVSTQLAHTVKGSATLIVHHEGHLLRCPFNLLGEVLSPSPSPVSKSPNNKEGTSGSLLGVFPVAVVVSEGDLSICWRSQKVQGF